MLSAIEICVLVGHHGIHIEHLLTAHRWTQTSSYYVPSKDYSGWGSHSRRIWRRNAGSDNRCGNLSRQRRCKLDDRRDPPIDDGFIARGSKSDDSGSVKKGGVCRSLRRYSPK